MDIDVPPVLCKVLDTGKEVIHDVLNEIRERI